MKKLLRPAILIPALFGFLFNVFVNIITEYVLVAGQTAVSLFFALFAILLLAALYYWTRTHPPIIDFFPPTPLRNSLDRERHARRGLIAIVSLYSPQRGFPAHSLSPAQRVAAAQAGDYHTLHFDQSNYAPLIKAVTSHNKNLDHCWLISTRAANGEPELSSRTYVPALVHHLRTQVKKGCRFYGHEDDSLVISLQDDILSTQRIHEIMQHIYTQAHAAGLAENDIVADITGGFRSLPLGMILACLDKERIIQFVGTAYDASGQPTGDLFPILFTFEVELDQ